MHFALLALLLTADDVDLSGPAQGKRLAIGGAAGLAAVIFAAGGTMAAELITGHTMQTADRPMLDAVAAGVAFGLAAMPLVDDSRPVRPGAMLAGPLLGFALAACAVHFIEEPRLRAAVALPVGFLAPFLMTLLVDALIDGAT